MRYLAALLFTVISSTSAAAAPSIGELLDKVAESNARVTRAAADVARARAAYEEQQAKVIAAAAALFGGEPKAAPSRSRLAALLDLSPSAKKVRKPIVLRPANPQRPLSFFKKSNPGGREIYDSLTFRR